MKGNAPHREVRPRPVPHVQMSKPKSHLVEMALAGGRRMRRRNLGNLRFIATGSFEQTEHANGKRVHHVLTRAVDVSRYNGEKLRAIRADGKHR